MGKKDPRVDAYIAKSAEFARPILKHIRRLAHRADPKIEETLKWSMPAFMHEGIICGMASFRRHCAFFFWKGAPILCRDGRRVDEAMGQFGRLASRADLPSDRKLIGYIRKAVALNINGAKVPGRYRRKAVARRVPAYFSRALRKNAKALAIFRKLSVSHRNEYVAWIADAKQEATRTRRIATALTWLAQGRNMNWRYERKSA